jgi:formamidopyrimidine-DNA glycosylase
MPELPEVEVLVRQLRPLLSGRRIRRVHVLRPRIIRPHSPSAFAKQVNGARIVDVARRGNFLLFHLSRGGSPFLLVGHLGMTGRMWIAEPGEALPKHAAAVFEVTNGRWVFEDTRYFGRLSLDASVISHLGPEPLDESFTASYLAGALAECRSPIKPKLLDQSLVAGLGNIYASEALHQAGVSPSRAARQLKSGEVAALWRAIRAVLRQAIRFGSTVPLKFGGSKTDGLFYYGSARETSGSYHERLLVYDRAKLPCYRCGTAILRTVQGGRSTFHCPRCQPNTPHGQVRRI